MTTFFPFSQKNLIEEPLYRELEFDELLASFRGVLAYPGEVMARVIIIGPPGSGKTFVCKNFQRRIEKQKLKSQKIDYLLKCVIVNCQNHSSSESVVLEIIRKIHPDFTIEENDSETPKLQYILADILKVRKEALIIIFDNIDSLVAKEPDEVNSLIYGFQRFSEGKENAPNLFSQILVANNLNFLSELDRSVFRRVISDVIPFEPYSAEETIELLTRYIKRNRIIYRGRINEENVWFISMISKGNMHRAINLIEGARYVADQNNQKEIIPEHVRHANKKFTEFQITEKELEKLVIGQKLMLLAIARRFRSNYSPYLNFLELPARFFSVCEEYFRLSLAKYFKEFFKELEKKRIISVHNYQNNIILTLADISATELIIPLEKYLKKLRKGSPYYL
ncbi:MAG: AAA family ATPase [Candidatus Heimdallarchaeota archaeon]|nr:AAA family ATPase [Candidatus Heimdallarchaeota archaeon]